VRKIKRNFVFVSIACFLGILGCQSPGAVVHTNKSTLEDIKKAITKVIGEPRNISENGRQYTSKFHDQKGRPDESVRSAKERRYTIITVQGDRRPYDIDIESYIERREADGIYDIIGTDDRLATEFSGKLKKTLYEGQDKRNIIDDFKAF
jgi:hypothetical protein